MFIRYYGSGIGHGDSTAVADVIADPAEAVYESPDISLEIEDSDEESDDDNGTDDPGESTDEETANIY